MNTNTDSAGLVFQLKVMELIRLVKMELEFHPLLARESWRIHSIFCNSELLRHLAPN